MPACTVADASRGYQGHGYRVILYAKNLFDKNDHAGVFNANLITLGDPRAILRKTVFDW